MRRFITALMLVLLTAVAQAQNPLVRAGEQTPRIFAKYYCERIGWHMYLRGDEFQNGCQFGHKMWWHVMDSPRTGGFDSVWTDGTGDKGHFRISRDTLFLTADRYIGMYEVFPYGEVPNHGFGLIRGDSLFMYFYDRKNGPYIYVYRTTQ